MTFSGDLLFKKLYLPEQEYVHLSKMPFAVATMEKIMVSAGIHK